MHCVLIHNAVQFGIDISIILHSLTLAKRLQTFAHIYTPYTCSRVCIAVHMWLYRYRDNFIAQQRTATGSASSGCAGLCFGLSITASRDTVACGHRQKPTNRRKQFQLSPQNEAAITTTHGRRRCHLFSIRVRNLFPSLTHNVTRRQPAPFPHRYAMSMESRSRSSFRLVTFSRRVFNGVGCL